MSNLRLISRVLSLSLIFISIITSKQLSSQKHSLIWTTLDTDWMFDTGEIFVFSITAMLLCWFTHTDPVYFKLRLRDFKDHTSTVG